MSKNECAELWDKIFQGYYYPTGNTGPVCLIISEFIITEPRKTRGTLVSAIKSLRKGEYCGLIKFEITFEDGHVVPFNSVLICQMTPAGKIIKYDNYLSGK